MLRKSLPAILFLIFLALTNTNAQDSVAATNSEITSATLPNGAQRLLPEKIPAEINQIFDEFLKQGAGKIAGGEREVTAWLGDYQSAGKATRMTNQLQANFLAAGWQFDLQGKQNGVVVFNLHKDGSPRRVVFGFFVPGEKGFVSALMETKLPDGKASAVKNPVNQPTRVDSSTNDGSAKIVTVEKDSLSVNVMGSEMPPMPSFPTLSPKPGKVRGYVKDWTGKPLADAEIGVRSSYFAGYYSGSQGKTDQNGYYELTPPKGSATIYNAGYQIKYGDGLAAVSLHPADGKLDSFVTTDGTVENFVMLPYGVTSREKLQQNAHLPSTFYGGAILFNWYSVEANDANAPAFGLRENAKLEITLTPEDTFGAAQTIVIRKTLSISSAFRVHNIPLGRYRLQVAVNGKPVKIKESRKFSQIFGMNPAETIGTASVSFVPSDAKAASVAPQHGNWKWLDLRLETP